MIKSAAGKPSTKVRTFENGARLCPAQRSGISRSGNLTEDAEELSMAFEVWTCCGWSSADTAALRRLVFALGGEGIGVVGHDFADGAAKIMERKRLRQAGAVALFKKLLCPVVDHVAGDENETLGLRGALGADAFIDFAAIEAGHLPVP